MLNSPAYIDVFKPYLESMRNSLSMRLLDRSAGRKEEYPDDYLAGSIVTIDGLLELFAYIIRETQFERIDTAMALKSPIEMYDRHQRNGRHDPVLGSNEPLYEPAPKDPGGALYVPPEEDY